MTNEEILKNWQGRMQEISRQMAQDKIVHFFSYGIVEKECENYGITASGALKGGGNEIAMTVASAIQQDKNIGSVLQTAIDLAKEPEETKE